MDANLYNSLAHGINEILADHHSAESTFEKISFGYGQESFRLPLWPNNGQSPSVTAIADLTNRFVMVAEHQNSMIDVTTDLEKCLTILQNNRFKVNPRHTYETAGGELAVERIRDWSSLVETETTFEFTSADHARYFFNSGNRLKIKLDLISITGGESANHFSALISSVGSVHIGADSIVAEGKGTPLGAGFYGLQTNYSNIFVCSCHGFTYGIYAKRDDNAITIKVHLSSRNTATIPGVTRILFDAITADCHLKTPLPKRIS